MYHKPDNIKNIRVIKRGDDHPNTVLGVCIPKDYVRNASKNRPYVNQLISRADKVVNTVKRYPEFAVASLLLLLTSSFFGIQATGLGNDSRAQVSTVIQAQYDSKIEREDKALFFGEQPKLTNPDFFKNFKGAVLSRFSSFIEVDIELMKITYYKEGQALQSYPIQHVFENDICKISDGFYQLQHQKDNFRISPLYLGLPWSLIFENHIFIHGMREHQIIEHDKSLLLNGCIGMKEDDAHELFTYSETDTPVLVFNSESLLHKKTFNDEIVYVDIENLSAKGFLSADLSNGNILNSTELHAVLPIASVTKLMTALVANDLLNLDTRLAIDEELFVYTVVPRLFEVDSISTYSLLELLLIESSNEASELLASQVGREEFVNYMNKKAFEIGMRNTHFVDPSGFSEANTSTVYDLLLLTKYIYNDYKFIFDITSGNRLSNSYDSDNLGNLKNFNRVDNFYVGKTGETTSAGMTSVTIHKHEIQDRDYFIAVIVLGSKDRKEDINLIVDYSVENL